MKKLLIALVMILAIFLCAKFGLKKEQIFSGVISFLVMTFIQWQVRNDTIAIWVLILIGILFSVIPLTVVVIFKIPGNITNLTFVAVPVFWGFIFSISLLLEHWCREITRNYLVVIAVLFHIFIFFVLPSVRIVLISSMVGLIFGLPTIYLWKSLYPNK